MKRVMYDYKEYVFRALRGGPAVIPQVGDLLYNSGPFAPLDDVYALHDLGLKAVLRKDDEFAELFEIVHLKSVQCFKCGGWYVPTDEELKLFAEHTALSSYDPTDWDCGCGDVAKKEDALIQEVWNLYLEQEEALAKDDTNHAANISVMMLEHPAYPAWKRAQIANAADVSTNEQGGLEQAF